MTHNDYECLHKIRYRWQKEQHLIRQKYQIPYNMTYISKQCFSKSISNISHNESLFKHELSTSTHNNHKKKIYQSGKHHFNIKNNHPNIPPMYCLKCHLYITECSCTDGLGQWWINLQKETTSTDKTSKNSIYERHVHFNSRLIDFSFSNECTNYQTTKSRYNKHLYILLDWNNRQSLINFLRTIKFNKNLSNMTIEQLRELITNNDYIHIFNSIIDLIISMNKNQHEISLCHIYIDPTYYSTIQNLIPLSQSQLIADNINLNQILYSIKKISLLLGAKIDQSINEFLQDKISTKQRQSILHQQSLLIAMKIPYNTFCNSFVHIQ